MRLTVFTLCLPMILLSCVSNSRMLQSIMRDQIASLDALSANDQLILDKNWKIAEEIADQDKMAWIGTDSVLVALNDNEKEMLKGYVVVGNSFNGEVYFYTYKEDSIIKGVASASFSNGKYSTTIKNVSITDSNITKSILCLQAAKDLNIDYINQQKVNYNSYSFFSDTGFTVYLAPGSVNDYFIFCGGIKTIFDKNLKLISNTELHRSIVVYKMDEIGDVLARSSSITDVINEIDILQYLIWKNVVYNQMIATRKYTFFLYNIPDENRIIKRVFTQEEKDRK